jgi:hypothetical protein
LQSLHEHLLTSFEKTFNFTNLYNNLLNANNRKDQTITINGNATVNLYHGNKNMQIKNSYKLNKNSHNIKTEIIENRDSHNFIHKGDFGLNLDLDLENKLLHSLVQLKKKKEGTSLTGNLLPTKNIKKKFIQENIENLPKLESKLVLPMIKIPQNETEKIVNNNYHVHNHIYVNDNSVNLVKSFDSKLFSINSTYSSGNQIENIIKEKPVEYKYPELQINKTMTDVNGLNNEIKQLNEEVKLQKVLSPVNEKIQNKSSIREKEPIIPIIIEEEKLMQKVEDKKPLQIVIEKKFQPVVENKIPQPKNEEKKPQPIVEEKNPQLIVQDKKPQLIVQDKNPQPKVEDKKPKLIVQDKKPQPKVEEKKPKLIVQDKKPQPKVEEKKPKLIVEKEKPEPKVEEKKT